MSKLRKAIEAEIDKQLGDGSTLRMIETTCAGLAADVEPVLGYPPALTSVSRVMGELGWDKITIDGKVAFRRPKQEGKR